MTCPDRDRILTDDFLRGDEKAFVEIYDRYWYKLYLSAYRRVRDKGAAEELVQNLFLKLWEKRATLVIRDLEHYLFSSIRNATIDFLNRQMVAGKYIEHQKLFADIRANTTEEMVEYSDLEGAIEKGLGALSGKSEMIFRLHSIDNWPVEKIANHLELSEKAVHYHLAKSQKFIRTFLQEYTLVLFTALSIL